VSAFSPIAPTNGAAGGTGGNTNPLVALGARATRHDAEGAAPAPRAAPLLRQEAAEVAPQVGRALASLLSREGGSVQIRLNPDWLGEVKVELTVREGRVIARLEAENETARELLAGSLDRLRATLEQRGLRVEKLEIADGSSGRESPEDPDGPGGRRTPAQDDPGPGGREAASGRTPWNGERGWAGGGEPDRRVERRRPEDGARPAETGGAGTDGPIDAVAARSASWWSVRLDTVA
jgi:flagellar hook-length control protein FliK